VTYARREEIFSKDIITIDELAELLNTNYQEAAKVMRNIKRRFDRYPHLGKLHVEDYKAYFEISDNNPRYFKTNEGGHNSVCI
jgi:hypothetical protein